MLLVRLFAAAWLLGWVVGQFLVSQVLEALILCKADGQDVDRESAYVLRIAADGTIDRTFAVPFLLGWLACWSCGGASMWHVLLGSRSRGVRTAPWVIAWVVALLAFRWNVAVLQAAGGCIGSGTWLACWLLLPVPLAALCLRFDKRRSAAGAHFLSPPSGREEFMPREVVPGSTLGECLRGALAVLLRPPPPPEALVKEAAHDLKLMCGEPAACAICFSPLCLETCAVLANRSQRRVCGHYFHLQCVRQMATSSALTRQAPACPLCRRRYLLWLPVPDVARRPRAWFELVDTSGRRVLSTADVVEACTTVLPVEPERLRRRLLEGRPCLWQRWVRPGAAGVEWGGPDGPQESFVRWLLAARRAAEKDPALMFTGSEYGAAMA